MKSPLISSVLRLPKVLRGKDFYFFNQTKCNKVTFGNEGANWTFYPNDLNQNSTVYSFGIGTDISFDLALIKKYGIIVHAFDPTPKSIEWLKAQRLPKEFISHEYGLASYNGKAKFKLPKNINYISHSIIENSSTQSESIEVEVLRLSTIMQQLNHKKIDVLKIDIEGAEYEVIDNILSENIDIVQILVEFHHRLKPFSIEKTKQAIQKLNKTGYKVFNVSSTGEEYSFIK